MAEARNSVREVLQLAGLLACCALATSRCGLIAHELIGHGGTALALGARITQVKLFWFAGGWIRYQLDAPTVAASLAIAMGGIAIELACGTVLWFAVRGPALGRRLVRGVGAALVLHGSWYFATGAFHGFGDGALLYHELGDARVAVAIAGGVIACAAAYAGARDVFGALLATLAVRHRIAGLIVAMLLAAGLNVALAATELVLRRDPTYVEIMQPERERVVERDLATWTANQRAAGIEITPPARAAEAARLEAVHRTFPFAWLLGVAAGLAALLGGVRTRPGNGDRISRRLLVIAAASAAGAVCAVGVIQVVLGA